MNTQENQIALVTGGSRGLARDMVLNLVKKGINVVFTYKSNEQAAKEVVAEIENSGQKALALQLDVSDHNKYADFFSNELSPRLQEKFHTSKYPPRKSGQTSPISMKRTCCCEAGTTVCLISIYYTRETM